MLGLKKRNGMDSHLSLNNGMDMPNIGLGVWQMAGQEAEQAVLWALEFGYRLIDTAFIYGNEAEVGNAIRQSGIPRQEIFVTTKLWRESQGYNSALEAFGESLEHLRLDYVDLYLIHWPYTGIGASQVRSETWQALEEIYSTGRARAIGVSNYDVDLLREMNTYAGVLPAVNQVEFHPFLFQKKLMEYCHKHTITLEAYSPLMHGEGLNESRISNIAGKYGKTNAQIVLRWNIQHGNIVIPKSSHKDRIRQNIDIFNFELSREDMTTLDTL